MENAYTNSAGAGSWINVHAVSAEEFFACVGEGIDRLFHARADGRQWVDGSPENLLVGGVLLRMFHQAHLFHVVRDPRSVCLSMLTSGFGEPWASDIDEAIRTWNHYIAAGLQLETDYPDRVSRIRQEDMLVAPVAVAHRIGTCLGIEDVAPIASFLADSRINMSAHKQSYVDSSPFRHASAAQCDRIEFEATYGERIRAETATLAARCGYA